MSAFCFLYRFEQGTLRLHYALNMEKELDQDMLAMLVVGVQLLYIQACRFHEGRNPLYGSRIRRRIDEE